MWPFSGKNKNDSLGLVFDIGSGSVGGAFISLHQDRPKILYSKRIPFRYSSDLSGAKLFLEMKKTLGDVLKDLEREGLKHLNFTKYGNREFKHAHVFLSSPWYISDTKLLKINKDKPFQVNRDLVRKAIIREEEDFEKSKEAQEAFHEDGVVIERKIVNMKLNGYEVEDPYGKFTNSVELSIFMSQTDKDVIKDVENLILKHFSFEEIEFNTFALSFFSTVRDIYGDIKDFLLIDITAEVTDVIMVRDRTLYENASFPKGRNFLLRKIAGAFNTIPEDALSILKIYLSDTTRQGEVEKMVSTLSEVKKEWLNNLSNSFSHLAKGVSVPEDIFFTADLDTALWFENIIKSEELSQISIGGGELNVTLINQGVLDPYIYRDKGIGRDVFISIDTLFVNKIYDLNSN